MDIAAGVSIRYIYISFRNPVSKFPEDLPADLKPWDEESMNYLAFTHDGAEVHTDYKKTYNKVMLDHVDPAKQRLYEEEQLELAAADQETSSSYEKTSTKSTHPRRIVIAEGDDEVPRPRVTLGDLGVLEGLTKMTMGNQDNEPKPINYFRNITFGEIPHRYAVSLDSLFLRICDSRFVNVLILFSGTCQVHWNLWN